MKLWMCLTPTYCQKTERTHFGLGEFHRPRRQDKAEKKTQSVVVLGIPWNIGPRHQYLDKKGMIRVGGQCILVMDSNRAMLVYKSISPSGGIGIGTVAVRLRALLQNRVYDAKFKGFLRC